MPPSLYHLLVDAHGLPLNVLISGANRHDSMLVEPILDSMPAIKRGGRGQTRRRPVKLHGDEGYDNPRVRRSLRRRGITARLARIGP
ncbi:Transposase DDE domain-containing protein [Geodermatophilus amargosae]|uniref:Transposase DDE domain-containing protein n=1 Tax=Geodermatophilus amargosae TaxID=1296565 RepID=A0A1I7BDU2_9ACTN|nr:Transposase DDE domain-containing protein [Geodermatophilus amargosae]